MNITTFVNLTWSVCLFVIVILFFEFANSLNWQLLRVKEVDLI
jgi:hypothetical protein